MAKKSKGLGDTIAKVTEVTGMDKVAKFILGEDCGCDKRKTKLNKLFPYGKSPNCLTEEEHDYLTSYFEENKTHQTARPSQKKAVTVIYDRVFQSKTNCSHCFPTIHQEITTIYETY